MHPRIRRPATWTFCIALAMVAACTGDRSVPTMVEETDQSTFLKGTSRKDTPWNRMTDAELVAAVKKVNGRVGIGFKDASSTDGVDERGRVLASPNAVAAGKAFLESLGVKLEYQFISIPAVMTTIDPALTPTIRHHPNVDYIEPLGTGTRDSGAWPVIPQ